MSNSSGSAASKSRHASERSRRKRMVEECVEKYKEHFSFLRDSKFLQDLENDSVDSDIIEEELSALHETPISIREKVVKFLQSNPFQILLCVIVLLDAGIVIAQILLDLNSVKDKLHRREVQLFQLIGHIRRTQAGKLCGYQGFDVDRILRLVGEDAAANNCTVAQGSGGGGGGGGQPVIRTAAAAAKDAGKSSNTTAFDDDDDDSSPVDSSNWTAAAAAADGSGGDRSAAAAAHRPDHGLTGDVELDIDEFRAEMQQEHDILHEVAHCLHFASIAMLGFLVVEVLVKIVAMGKNFCKHKIEIFDAKIIIASFAIDIIFLGGVAGEEGPKAAAVLVILLLWRIARVVDGIVVTVKQRQEFRIRLQKRARRTAEKKMETFEEERHAKTKQIEALKDLCSKAGITDADIAACAPKHQRQVNTTLCALSSVARLSVSMTMLMSSGIYRPRFFEDGLVLPKVFGPKTAKDAPPQQQQQRSAEEQQLQLQQPIGCDAAVQMTAQRTETQNNSSSLRGKQRKMAFVKSGRKQLPGLISDGFESYHHPVIEAAEDGGAGQLLETGSSSSSSAASSNPTPTNAVQTTAAAAAAAADCPLVSSPVNSSGVHILIDLSSDVECDDDDHTAAAAAEEEEDDQTGSGRRGDACAEDDAPGKTTGSDSSLVDLEAVGRETAIATRLDDCESTFSNMNSAQRV